MWKVNVESTDFFFLSITMPIGGYREDVTTFQAFQDVTTFTTFIDVKTENIISRHGRSIIVCIPKAFDASNSLSGWRLLNVKYEASKSNTPWSRHWCKLIYIYFSLWKAGPSTSNCALKYRFYLCFHFCDLGMFEIGTCNLQYFSANNMGIKWWGTNNFCLTWIALQIMLTYNCGNTCFDLIP